MELLEKRVKSRFSHRQINLFCDYSFEDYVEAFKSFLSLPADFSDREYRQKWEKQIEVEPSYVCHLFSLIMSGTVSLSVVLSLCLSPSLCLVCLSVCLSVCCSPVQELSLNAKVRAALKSQYDTFPDIGSLKSFLVSAR